MLSLNQTNYLLFICRKFIDLLIYVDDIVIIGPYTQHIRKIKGLLYYMRCSNSKILVLSSIFWGWNLLGLIDIHRHTLRILKDTRLLGAPLSILMDPHVKLKNLDVDLLDDALIYHIQD